MDQQNASLKTHPISSALQSASAVSAMQSWAFAAIMVSFSEHKDCLLIRIYDSLSFPQILFITAASPFRQCAVLISLLPSNWDKSHASHLTSYHPTDDFSFQTVSDHATEPFTGL